MSKIIQLPEPGVNIPKVRKRVLEYLIKAGEPMTRSDLIANCDCGKSTVVYLMYTLIEGNHVSRTVVERPGGTNQSSDNVFYGFKLRAPSRRLFARLLKEQDQRTANAAKSYKNSGKKKAAQKKAA